MAGHFVDSKTLGRIGGRDQGLKRPGKSGKKIRTENGGRKKEEFNLPPEEDDLRVNPNIQKKY